MTDTHKAYSCLIYWSEYIKKDWLIDTNHIDNNSVSALLKHFLYIIAPKHLGHLER